MEAPGTFASRRSIAVRRTRPELMTIFLPSLALLAVSLTALLPLQAQTFGGQAVDAATREPLVGLDVRLLHHREGLPRPMIVDSTRTDERGLFEFRVTAGAVYQAEFGPWRAPYSLGAIDTVRSGAVRRRYIVPTPQVAPLRATLGEPVPATAMRTRPSPLRVGGRAAFGALLGSAAGYLVAELRCGRIEGCEPTRSYPYLPFGAIMGAALGSGSGASDAGCRFGMARGVAGAVLGGLAGSFVASSGGQRHASTGLGAIVGGTALAAACRLGSGR